MALDARSQKEWFAEATSVNLGTGVVVYNVPSGSNLVAGVRAKEYNARKLELLREQDGPYGLNALVWWNDSRQLATLRVRPSLFADGSLYKRLPEFLRSCNAVLEVWPLKDEFDHKTKHFGWRFRTKAGKWVPGFEHCLVAFMETVLQGRGEKRVAKGDAQVSQSKREDESTMKNVYPVLVCKRTAKKEGAEKQDGDFIGGFAPKFVPAVCEDAAKTKIVAELIAAEKYGDPDDPDVSIRVCSPLA